MPANSEKTFDCLEMKRIAQAQVSAQIKGLTVDEQLVYWKKRHAEMEAEQRVGKVKQARVDSKAKPLQKRPHSNLAKIATACLLLATSLSLAATGTIDATAKYAYSENATWINFAPTDGGVTVTRKGLSGYAWCKGAGWIKLGSDTSGTGTAGPYANTNATDWGVNVTYSTNVPGGGTLSGYGWSETSGWINFAPKDGGVTIGADGTFDGTPGAGRWASFTSTKHRRSPSKPRHSISRRM